MIRKYPESKGQCHQLVFCRANFFRQFYANIKYFSTGNIAQLEEGAGQNSLSLLYIFRMCSSNKRMSTDSSSKIKLSWKFSHVS